ncbi:helix-turn-helix domain-containing protein [Macrococcus armenti]|uniref:helix-turn-helix domain-containing protein n=1 Tax=Macrococcus armenti TaxID=2875764 RepID=UPI001CCDD8FE|nr:helix-turn-helix transcriptional regulator [Macrococcus armenti]UBH16367.1 helix-turn-helix transcriptional regulator [Macrococcus armenti]UBH18723.1 helix-turn-helix transcriptional regulator [Macrococcus armenti]UBH20995.1 helix-turn-helix transcriptional regulator [Macrococcus armenti]
MTERQIKGLRNWRQLRGLTQEELSEKSGITSRSIKNYEKDVKNLHNAQYSTVKQLADALDIQVSQIFLEGDSEIPKFEMVGDSNESD